MKRLDAPTRWALWTLVVIVPFYSLAAHFGYDDTGFAAGLFIASVGTAARAHWDWRRRIGYAIAVVVLAIIHIGLVMLLPWPKWNLSGAAFMPIGFLDFLADYWVIHKTVVPKKGQRASAV